jgi:hypothetical protein
MYLVVGALGAAAACEPNADDQWSLVRAPLSGMPARTTPDAAVDPPNCSQYTFRPDHRDPLTIACPRDVCGVNGIWLGQGVPFRTLNLDGSSNDQGLVIQSFESANHESLVVDVEGDSLIGRLQGGDHLEGIGLKDASLRLLSVTGTTPLFINFHIDDVPYMPFAAQCKQGHTCDSRLIPVYRFSATTSTGCAVQLCKPGINPPDGTRNDLEGDALIFEGDLYDENTFEVNITPMKINSKRTFNIACVGTTISKLHLLRHTSASQSPYVDVTDQPDKSQREALLRMFTGDYCGRGDPPDSNNLDKSSLFTENGVPIWITFNSGAYVPTKESRYLPTGTPMNIDGRWDSTGATCMTNPRLSLKDPNGMVSQSITQTCTAAMHSLQYPCTPSGSEYLFSYNPSPNQTSPP